LACPISACLTAGTPPARQAARPRKGTAPEWGSAVGSSGAETVRRESASSSREAREENASGSQQAWGLKELQGLRGGDISLGG